MAFIVEMARGKPNTPQFGYYSCSRDAWGQLLAIASGVWLEARRYRARPIGKP